MASLRQKAILPFVVLAIGLLGVALLWTTRPEAVATTIETPAPVVRVMTVQPGAYQFRVAAHGTVEPRRQSDLVSQVSGEVIWVSPALVPGGFFEAEDVLLRIDKTDYEADLESARSVLARASSEADRANKDRGRQRRLANQSVASQSRIDDAENAARVAGAVLREAEARVGKAERDLERTELSAPYAGRVRAEDVDLGQFVTRGQPVAKLYAVDYAEVRLPLPDRELRYLEVPLGYRKSDLPKAEEVTGDPSEGESRAVVSVDPDEKPSPRVQLSAEFAGRAHQWDGEIVRTEGELDPKSRMVTVVARVEDPYGRATENDRPPFAVGLFVEAEIEGRLVDNAVVLPRESLVGDAQVVVIDPDGRVELRTVKILRAEREQIVVTEGLSDGDRVSVNPLPGAVDGMMVRVLPEEAS